MENDKKIYIISFGASNIYKLVLDRPDESASRPLVRIERELNDYLRSLFPNEPFAYFTTPTVEEVDWDRREEFSDYPYLDDKAVREIKETLATEVADRAHLRKITSNAPYAAVAPAN